MTLFRSATTTGTSRPVARVSIPDSKLAREVTELVRDTEPPLLFHHSSRVYYWGALTGQRRGDRERGPAGSRLSGPDHGKAWLGTQWHRPSSPARTSGCHRAPL